MIICGFPGTGKTMMAMQSTWVDLESTPFKKNWLLYAEVAKHMSDNGYTVMVSTHEEMLNALEQIEVRYVVVIPPITDKATYLHRYDMRGNTYDFIRLLDENWEKWITTIVKKPTVLKTIVVLPKDGCIKAFADMRGES
jgi:KaiC/GvpD/RAD55 family RecA-like ATPase